jgi:cardiolipin synthase
VLTFRFRSYQTVRMVTATNVSILTVTLYLLDLAIKVVALGLVPEGRRPSSATAWLLLILFLPVIGLLVFWLIGSPFVDRGRRRRQAAAGEVISGALIAETDDLLPVPAGSTLNTLVVLNRRLGWLPAVDGNQADLFSDYDESIATMAREVRTAERYVHVEFYIMSWDSTTKDFFEALAEVAGRGVKVRLMFDHIGTARIPGYRDMIKKLKQTSIEWHPMLPIEPLKGKWRRPDLRNHRKIVVVDGRAAFVGSLNMIDASYHNRKHERAGRKWRELVMQLSGPVVLSLNIVFATDWYLETDEPLREDVQPYPYEVEPGDVLCQVVPSGPGFPDENNLRLFNSLIYSAQRRLSITSPYFVPDDSLLYAITTAAQRGIDVELFVGEQGDQFMVHHAQSSYYRTLLNAGVKIYLYPAPFVLHSKHFSVDDDVAVIGSSNMDIRSFNLDFEVSVMCVSRSLTTAMRQVEDHYRSLSRELTLAEWNRRPLWKRYIDNVMRLTAALQ